MVSLLEAIIAAVPDVTLDKIGKRIVPKVKCIQDTRGKKKQIYSIA